MTAQIERFVLPAQRRVPARDATTKGSTMRVHCIAAMGVSVSFIASTGAQDIIVALDMDAAQPGIQQSVTVPPGTAVVEDVAVYIWDTTGQHLASAVGCFQCSARMTMAMGHFRGDGRIIGHIDSLEPTLGEPVIAGVDHIATTRGFFNPFNGPTVEYYANTQFIPNSQGPFQSTPARPQFTVDVNLRNPTAGDVYRFYLIDINALVGGGAFSVAQAFSFEAGGDAVPDLTPTTQGVDLDRALPSPPAPFLVDYRDGQVTGGGATIIIDGCYPRLRSVHRCGRVGCLRLPVCPEQLRERRTLRVRLRHEHGPRGLRHFRFPVLPGSVCCRMPVKR